jgi:DNA-binding CsgD family transcriptional regulator
LVHPDVDPDHVLGPVGKWIDLRHQELSFPFNLSRMFLRIDRGRTTPYAAHPRKIPAVRTVMVGNASAVEVLSASRAVAAGEAVGPPRFSAPLFRGAAQQLAIRQNLQVRSGVGRSQSEQQLVELTRWGLTNKEIASRLNPSEHTVKNHVHRILRKTKDIRLNRDRGTLPRGNWLIPLQPTHCIVKRCLELKPPKAADDHAADRRTEPVLSLL